VRHKLQSSGKALLREKERIGTAKEKVVSSGQVAQKHRTFVEKSGKSLQEGIG
jgi:hypothetical protein